MAQNHLLSGTVLTTFTTNDVKVSDELKLF